VLETRKDRQPGLANRLGQLLESRARELAQFDFRIHGHHENRVGHDRKGFDDVREYESRPMSPSELAGMGQGETRRLGKIDSTENNVDGLALHVAHFKPPSRSARSRQYRRTLRTLRIDTDRYGSQ